MNKAHKADNRHGTRRYRDFIASMVRGNGMAGGMTAALAKPRIEKKAQRLLWAGVRPEQAQGRVVRACMRAIVQAGGAA